MHCGDDGDGDVDRPKLQHKHTNKQTSEALIMETCRFIQMTLFSHSLEGARN